MMVWTKSINRKCGGEDRGWQWGQSESESHPVMSDSLWPHGLYNLRNSLGQNTGVGSHSLLQEIFPTQGSNLGLPHRRRILYQLGHKGSPRTQYMLAKKKKKKQPQTFLPARWLRLWTLTAGGMGLILGWGTKIPHAMWCSQKKIFLML